MTEQHTIESFVEGLQAMWSAEKLLTEAMPQMIERAQHLGLRKNLAMHLAETDQQKEALRGFCFTLGYPHEGAENQEIQTLLAEGQRAMDTQVTDKSMNKAIIDGAIKVEHYEIAQYTKLVAAATSLGYEGIAARLALSLEEERQADAKLNFIRRQYIEQTAEAGMPGVALQ